MLLQVIDNLFIMLVCDLMSVNFFQYHSMKGEFFTAAKVF